MSWQAVVFALLALVVGGGIAWYERSHPSSRLIALIAALTALAVAGRLALAPIPNVVATTDIVLITGYALGAAPGFAVGALAAVVSNIWLGQGPWTPWQMAGWGLVGIGGAAVAQLTGRELGRIGLAAACGIAGLAYGALLDFSVLVTYGGEQSLDRYLALSARGIPFNVAHALGNIALALAAGPALVRTISRYRTRFDFRWHPAGATLVALAVLVIGFGSAPGQASAQSGRAWLEGCQNRDGGFGAECGSDSNLPMTGWAVLGLEATGRNPLDLAHGGTTAIDYMRRRAADIRSTGDLERSILALTAAGVSPANFGGVNLVAALRDRRSGNGSFSNQVNLTAFGLLALRAGGAEGGELRRSASWLRRAQNGDGGWGFQRDAQSDADSTGASLQGLAAAGAAGRTRAQGVSFLRHVQLGDGGWPLAGQSSSNSQSTAWAVQGAIASGVAPQSLRKSGRTPLGYLSARQASNGHYRYSASSDQTPVWVTGQALLATNRQAFPLQRVPRSSEPGGLPPPEKSRGNARVQDAGAGRTAGKAPNGTPPKSHGTKGGPRHAGREAASPKAKPKGDATHVNAAAAASTDATPVAQHEDAHESRTLLLGLAGIAVALGAGFLWYRRSLP